MNLINLFATPLWSENFDLYITKDEIEQLRQLCYKMQEIDPKGNVISNRGGWQSYSISPKQDGPFKCSLTDMLIERINASIITAIQSIGGTVQHEVEYYWININKTDDYNDLHHHGMKEKLSGCYYINVPEDSRSNIVFYDYSSFRRYTLDHLYKKTRNKRYIDKKIDFKPVNNQLFIFPTWLEHSVSPNKSKEDRISIAFNTTHKVRNNVKV